MFRDHESRSPRKTPRVATWLESAEERLAFSAWLEERRRAGKLSKVALAAALGEGYLADGGSSSVNRYLEKGQVPRPTVMRKLSTALGIPWLEVIARAGYYRELVDTLDDLIWLGGKWLEEDDARGTTSITNNREWSYLRSIEQGGVLRFGDRRVWDARDEQWFKARYHVACWIEPEHDVEYVTYPMIEQAGGVFVPDMTKEPDSVEIRHEEERSVYTVLPKPIALAIWLLTLFFPRRGDIFRDGAGKYAEELWNASTELVEETEKQRRESKILGRPKKPDPLLQCIASALDNRNMPFSARRTIAAEYAQIWADQICNRYTHIARLAAFARWGEAGSSVSTQTAFAIVPQHRIANLPDPREFAFPGS